MIESGAITHKNTDTLLDDDEVISNYYDTLDSISNSVSETTNDEMHHMENPMLESMVIGTDSLSYETQYEDIASSSSSEVIDNSEHDEVDETEEIEQINKSNFSVLNQEQEQEEEEDIYICPLHEEFINTEEKEEKEKDKVDDEKEKANCNQSLTEKKLKIMVNPILYDTSYQDNIDRLQTGDIVMCHGGKGDSLIDKSIEYFTHSPWEHAAMIIRDPWWISDKLEDGIYVFQSGSGPNSYSDVINGSNSGVTLNRLDDFLVNREGVYIRTLNNFELDGGKKFLFRAAFETAHGKPYDKKPEHWTAACIGSFFRCPCISRSMLPREKNEFWCSALVSFMYTKMEWVPSNTDWSCKTPNDLMSIKLKEPYTLSDVWKLK